MTSATTAQLSPVFNTYFRVGQSNPQSARAQTAAITVLPTNASTAGNNEPTQPNKRYYLRHILMTLGAAAVTIFQTVFIEWEES